MIVFDLQCRGHGHVFEAWFANSGAFEDQRARGLIACPICGDGDVAKALMAPNIPAKGNARETLPVAKCEAPAATEMKAMLAALAKAQSKALQNSTWVGRDFDKQARAMDAGEIDKSSIHGEVSAPEAKSLIEDGIGVMPLPLPFIPPDKRN
jgi:hypothetical protein